MSKKTVGNSENIISRLRGLAGRLNRSEQRVLDAVLSDLEGASTATGRVIARAAGVSEPTLTRFCKTIGCGNFQDFKNRLARNLAVGNQYFPRDAPNQKDFVVVDVISFALDSLRKTARQVDAATLRRATKIIAGAERLVIMGLGGQSSSLAGIAENRFFRLGIASRAYSDGYLQRMAASVLGKNDAALVISASGRAKDLIDSVKIARRYGARTISITKKGSPLSRATDVSIQLALEEDDNNYKPSSSRYGFLAVIDMLAMGAAIARGDASLKNLKRIRQNLFPSTTQKTILGD